MCLSTSSSLIRSDSDPDRARSIYPYAFVPVAAPGQTTCPRQYGDAVAALQDVPFLFYMTPTRLASGPSR